ncbi:microcin C ABC transporter permease YejB [Aestuariivirga litoralis]|uniref:microcin C ABC transporter permease YejB n=1 Tax=Aestuariivirga litoralis TaxID=2650924 RepID=UPI0018C7BCE2|nr:microcin C ABC transporter permease YejB [Aestuariivirga litoralis]MBG1232743.1 microcin C ABC transporter permease YejB [Aestuariivirga litoralis]
MGSYIVKRLLLMIPTLLGALAITFLVTQFVPGGPVEQLISKLDQNSQQDAQLNGGSENLSVDANGNSTYRGARGIDPAIIKKWEKQFGFDKPPLERFGSMIWNYARFDFGDSYFQSKPVGQLILSKLPVSISLGIWLMLISYAISIPLGIAKAVREGTRFDVWTSAVISFGYAIPNFIFAIFLIVLFAGGSYWNWFPLRGLTSDNFSELSLLGKIGDYFWHLTLPLIAMGVSAFATTTLLTKNSFLDEIRKQYVITARAKGLSERRVLYGHVFRNAMLLVISGFPGAFISAFFTGSLLIEQVFSLDGLGLLTYKSAVNRDYAVVFASLWVFTLIGLFIALISDLMYTWIDPRIDFESREV